MSGSIWLISLSLSARCIYYLTTFIVDWLLLCQLIFSKSYCAFSADIQHSTQTSTGFTDGTDPLSLSYSVPIFTGKWKNGRKRGRVMGPSGRREKKAWDDKQKTFTDIILFMFPCSLFLENNTFPRYLKVVKKRNYAALRSHWLIDFTVF